MATQEATVAAKKEEAAIAFIIENYGRANHPSHSRRSIEFRSVSTYAARYGHTVDDFIFDEAIARRFGDGMEFEGWAPESD